MVQPGRRIGGRLTKGIGEDEQGGTTKGDLT